MKQMMTAAAMAAVLCLAGTAGAEKKSFKPREVTGVVNINTASLKELELLPGVGRKTAGMIVAHREKNPFKAPADIMKVKGVGPGIFAKVKTFVTVSGPTTLAVKKGDKPASAPTASAAPQGAAGVAPN